MRARALNGEAARREKRGRPLPSRAFSHARGHLRVSGVLLDGPRKLRETARSLPQITRATTFVPSKIVYKNYLNRLFIGRSPHSYRPISVCALTSSRMPEISAAIKCLFFIQNFFFLFFAIQRIVWRKVCKSHYSLLTKKKRRKRESEWGGRKKEKRKKAMVVVLVFILATLEIALGRKKTSWPKKNPARCIRS